MREADADRSWQADHETPWTSIRKKFQTRYTRRIQRKTVLIGYSPSQLISRTWRCLCSHIPLKERTQIRKVMLRKVGTQKWKHSILTHFTQRPKEIYSMSGWDWWLEWKQLSAKIDSRNNHQFAAVVLDLTTQWMSPVWNQNFTGDGEEFYGSFVSRLRSQKLLVNERCD